MISLTSALSNRFKQKIISATVIDVIGRKCAVRLSGNGTKLTNLDYIGSKPSIGDSVLLDYRNANIPSVLATTNPTPPAPTTQAVCTLPDGTPTVPPTSEYNYPPYNVPPVVPSTTINYRTYSWTFANPVAGGIGGGRLFDNQVPVRVDAYCVGPFSNFAFRVQVKGTPDGSSLNICSDIVIAVPWGVSTTSFALPILPADTWLWLDIVTIVGAPTLGVVTFTTQLGS